MHVSDFKKDDFYSLRADCEIWGKKTALYVEFDEKNDDYAVLTAFLPIINERVQMLDSSREEVIDFILSEVTAQRLGIDDAAVSQHAFVSEFTVYCDDGMKNVWVNAFVEFGEGAAVVQIEISMQNEIGCTGICG